MKNKIKIIDLLNMISKGEELPNKIKYDDTFMFYSIYDKDYLVDSDDEYIGLINNCEVSRVLNDDIEILDGIKL